MQRIRPSRISKSEAGKLGWLAAFPKHQKRYLEKREEYAKDPKRCLECNTPIPYDVRTVHKFCGQRCSAISSNRSRLIKPGPPRTRKYKFCLVCNKEHEMAGDLCRTHEHNRQVEAGLIHDRATLKDWLIRKRGRCCECCGGTEWRGQKIPLELDHIDGNAGDDRPINIRLLCPNCHAQTPTAKGKNRGRGRWSRGLPCH